MNSGCFKKGIIPWNKGLKGTHFSPDTEFKPGQNVGKDHPSWKGGVQRSKKDGPIQWTGNGTRTRLARYNYERYIAHIPFGHVIWHKDLNKENDHPTNLEAISRSTMMRRNAKNHH